MSAIALQDQQMTQQKLECAIAQATGERVRIRSIARHPGEHSSSYQTERLTLRLEGGRTIALFLKNFACALLSKSNAEQRSTRELWVYRDLLFDADLGTARYYGWLGEPTGETGCLILEYVPGLRLSECDRRHWPMAAAWLAKLHGFFQRHPERLAVAADFLERHDQAFYWNNANKTLRALEQRSAPQAQRLREVLRGYDRLVEMMAAQELTLVHGSYRATDLLLDPGAQRVCPIDWERAAIGSRYLDLAFLSVQMSPPELRDFFDAYCASAERSGIVLPPRDELERNVACLHVHRLMDRVRKWPKKVDPGCTLEQLVERVATLAGSL